MTAALSTMVLESGSPVAVSVRAPGTVLPPPRMSPGTSLGRSTKALLPGPGSSWLPAASVARGVFGPVGSKWTLRPNRFSPAESAAMEAAAVGASTVEFWKLLPVKVNGGKPSSKVTSISPPSLNAGDCSIMGM